MYPTLQYTPHYEGEKKGVSTYSTCEHTLTCPLATDKEVVTLVTGAGLSGVQQMGLTGMPHSDEKATQTQTHTAALIRSDCP